MNSNPIYCPSCREEISVLDRFCAKCGADLRPTSSQAAQPKKGVTFQPSGRLLTGAFGALLAAGLLYAAGDAVRSYLAPAKAEDIEIHATYVKQEEAIGSDMVFDGNITNTGSKAANVTVYCEMKGFFVGPKDGSYESMELDPNVSYRPYAALYRNLKPGETRPVHLVVPCPLFGDQLKNLPEGDTFSGSYTDHVGLVPEISK